MRSYKSQVYHVRRRSVMPEIVSSSYIYAQPYEKTAARNTRYAKHTRGRFILTLVHWPRYHSSPFEFFHNLVRDHILHA